MDSSLEFTFCNVIRVCNVYAHQFLFQQTLSEMLCFMELPSLIDQHSLFVESMP